MYSSMEFARITAGFLIPFIGVDLQKFLSRTSLKKKLIRVLGS